MTTGAPLFERGPPLSEIQNSSIFAMDDISDEEMNSLIDGTVTDFNEGDLVTGTVVKVERDVALSTAAEVHARELVAAAIEAAGGAATTSVLREALGVSRKRAISILEHLDAVRFTVLDKEAGGLRSLR